MNKLWVMDLLAIPSLPGAQEIASEIVRDYAACFGTCETGLA